MMDSTLRSDITAPAVQLRDPSNAILRIWFRFPIDARFADSGQRCTPEPGAPPSIYQAPSYLRCTHRAHDACPEVTPFDERSSRPNALEVERFPRLAEIGD